MGRAAGGRVAAALAAGLASVIATASPARAAEPFTEEVIRAEIARLVAPLWRVDSLALEALPLTNKDGGKDGSKDAQRAAARVSARVALTVPTYLVDSREGAVTFLRPAADTGLEKTLTAIALAARSGGGWTVKIEPQNPEVLEGVGRPAAELPGRTVLAGSDEARALRERIDQEARQRLAEETARRARAEELLVQQAATAKAEVERADRERAAVEARAARIADLRAKLLGPDRPARIAAFEAALGGNDTGLRQLAAEAAFQSRDPVLANLALRDWIARRRAVPVQVFATKEDPGSETVVQNLGPVTLEIEGFNPADGAVAGRLGAPGYSIAKPSSIIGALAQTELALNSYGCALTLRLTEHRSLDGLLRCQTLPTLIARITLD